MSLLGYSTCPNLQKQGLEEGQDGQGHSTHQQGSGIGESHASQDCSTQQDTQESGWRQEY